MILFVHIPKTGGTSMDVMFKNYMYENNHYVFNYGKKINTYELWNQFLNSDMSVYMGHIDYAICHTDGENTFPNDLLSNTSYKDKHIKWVTIIRDPIRRTISEYYFLKWGFRNDKGWLFRSVKNRITLPSTLEEYINTPISFNTQSKYLMGKGLFIEDEHN